MSRPGEMVRPTTPVQAVSESEQRLAAARWTRSGVAQIEKGTTTRRRVLEDGPLKSTEAPAFRY